jgi:uncharacterized protein (DUF305 family)
LKRYTRLGLAALLAAVVLLVAACGGAGDMGNMEDGQMKQEGESARENEKGTDHSRMDRGSGDTSSGMVMKNGEYSDRRFIDAMVPHHEGAVDMAEVALKNAEHEEVRQLARDVVSTQQAEIRELKAIKQKEFGTSEVPAGMDMKQMEDMGMMVDPQSLADEDPFDKAFIDNMIPHHRSAIEMAEVAAAQTTNPRIRDLANDIVDAQEREISQMQRWRERWYPQS